MKKPVILLLAFMVALLLTSCSKEVNEETELGANFTIQQTHWKTATITDAIVENQKAISHYEFNAKELENLVSKDEVTYVWFDLGLNTNNQITFSATAEDVDEGVVGEIPSQIITTSKNNTNITILKEVEGVRMDEAPELTHILPNQDAHTYIANANKSYAALEAGFTQSGRRVERFRLDVRVVKRMLRTHDISSLALFLGENKEQKMTTVFMAKDKTGSLIIDEAGDINTNGRAFDFSRPCPPHCGSDCGGCADYCEDPWWMCCIAEPPCGEDDDDN